VIVETTELQTKVEKMKISRLLLKPSLDRLEQDLFELENRVFSQHSQDSLSLKILLDRTKSKLQDLKSSSAYLEAQPGAIVPADIYQSYKNLKMDHHLILRKWQRVLSNEARMKKIQEKRSHVSTFAA
jgi:hypothetical protein